MNKFISFLILVIGFSLMSCAGDSDAFIINGKVEGFSDKSIAFDLSPFNTTAESFKNVAKEEDGSFSITLKKNPGAGIYRLRTDGKQCLIVMDGSESEVSVQANKKTFTNNTFDITGSPSAQSFNLAMKDQYQNKMGLPQVEALIKNVKNPYVAQAYASKYLKNRADFSPYHESILERLRSEYPEVNHDGQIRYLNTLKKQLAQRKRKEKIKIGQTAPEISMPDANGKIRKLSDLKGKVVLVDFWASWCGPCRRANPEVVRLYDEFKDQGFDVFSVSLDGLGNQDKKRYRLDDASFAKRVKNSKSRWLQAIEKDKLSWENHVSELKKWDTPSAKTYGVTGIPKTFLIDRQGNIAAVNPRHKLRDELIKQL